MIERKPSVLPTRVLMLGLVAVATAGSLGCAAIQPGCGAAIGCGMATPGGCGCEIEPGCGCAEPCGPSGCSHAGERFVGDCGCGPRRPLVNVCEGPCCGSTCEPGCGVGGCGGAVCGCGQCPAAGCLAFGVQSIGEEFRRVFGSLGLCCGCGGCDSEVYWSEWHNDPPACCDPCDDCGAWVGPTAKSVPPAEFKPRRVAKLPGDGDRRLR